MRGVPNSNYRRGDALYSQALARLLCRCSSGATRAADPRKSKVMPAGDVRGISLSMCSHDSRQQLTVMWLQRWMRSFLSRCVNYFHSFVDDSDCGQSPNASLHLSCHTLGMMDSRSYWRCGFKDGCRVSRCVLAVRPETEFPACVQSLRLMEYGLRNAVRTFTIFHEP